MFRLLKNKSNIYFTVKLQSTRYSLYSQGFQKQIKEGKTILRCKHCSAQYTLNRRYSTFNQRPNTGGNVLSLCFANERKFG